jgi:hypothetical protein
MAARLVGPSLRELVLEGVPSARGKANLILCCHLLVSGRAATLESVRERDSAEADEHEMTQFLVMKGVAEGAA